MNSRRPSKLLPPKEDNNPEVVFAQSNDDDSSVRKRKKSSKIISEIVDELEPESKQEVNDASESVTDDVEQEVKVSLKRKRADNAGNSVVNVSRQSTGDIETRSTVYVEGISYDSSEVDVRGFFESRGLTVVEIRMPTYHNTGCIKGYAHVVLGCPDECAQAITFNGQELSGRWLKIESCTTARGSMCKFVVNNREQPPECRTVFVKNLPYDVTEAALREVFQVCGIIASVRLNMFHPSRQLKGNGYIDFKKEEGARIAVSKSGFISIGGRSLFVDYEVNKPKAGYRNQDGELWIKIKRREDKARRIKKAFQTKRGK